jgi:addiction module HigA family antidote
MKSMMYFHMPAILAGAHDSFTSKTLHGERIEQEALNMSAAELARQLKVPTNRITHILNGQRAITGDTALRLGHFFGTSAEFWLNLQHPRHGIQRPAQCRTWKILCIS